MEAKGWLMCIKVLHLIDSSGLYGAEIVLLNLVEEQIKSGLNPLILSAGTPDIKEKAIETEARKRGLPVKSVRMKAGVNIIKAFQIIRFAKNERFNILHSHGYKFDILLGMFSRKIRGMPIVTTVHGYIPQKGFTKMAVYQWVDRCLIRNFDRVVFVNKNMLEQNFFKRKVFKNISVINNGVNTEREEKCIQKQKLFFPDYDVQEFMNTASFLIGVVGRLSKEKGVQDLLCILPDLINKVPGVKLLVVGDGAYKNNLLSIVTKLELDDHVCFVGYSDETYFYLSRLDVFVMPSHTEGLPMILLEAMLAHCLVVASNVGGIPEVLKDGCFGYLIEPKNRESLFFKLLEICRQKDNNGDTKIIKDRARKFVTDEYSGVKMANSYASVYMDVLNDN